MSKRPPPNVYDFDALDDLLSAIYLYREQSIRNFTLSLWSKQLAFQSPRSVAMVLKGQRLPSFDMIQKMAQDLGWSAEEKQYIHLLVQRTRLEKRGASSAKVRAEMLRLKPLSQRKVLAPSEFSVVKEWHYLVIRQLMDSPGFKNSASWIASKLRHKITPEAVRRSMKKIHKILKDSSVATQSDMSSASIREHHAQMLDRAKEALEEQFTPLREFTSLTLLFDSSRLTEAKKFVRAFRDEFDQKFYSEKSNHVYQLNVQFFEHTSGDEG